jgi:uncharacterized membrane protein
MWTTLFIDRQQCLTEPNQPGRREIKRRRQERRESLTTMYGENLGKKKMNMESSRWK